MPVLFKGELKVIIMMQLDIKQLNSRNIKTIMMRLKKTPRHIMELHGINLRRMLQIKNESRLKSGNTYTGNDENLLL